MVQKRKTEAMAAKCQRAKGGMSLSNKEEENYERDTKDKTNSDQAGNNKNQLQF